MRFTVETEPLIRMLELLTEPPPRRHRPHAQSLITLTAGLDRLCVANDHTAAETDAAVWEDGRCAVPAATLLHALKRSRQQQNLTLETRGHSLNLGDLTLQLATCPPAEISPKSLTIFITTSLGIVSSQFPVPTGRLAPQRQ